MADATAVLGEPIRVTLTNANQAYGVAFPQNARRYRIRSRSAAAFKHDGSTVADGATGLGATGEVLTADLTTTHDVYGVVGRGRNFDTTTRRVSIWSASAGTVVEVTALL